MYTPTAAHVPGLTRKHQSRFESNYAGTGFDLMGAYAITDRLAIEGSWYFRHELQYVDSAYHPISRYWQVPDSVRYLRLLSSIGLAYTFPFDRDRHFFLSTSAGYGKGRLRMSERDMSSRNANGMPPAHFSQYYASMQRVYVQPAFLVQYDAVQVIASLRWSWVRYGFRHGTTLEPFDVSPHRTYGFHEVAATLRYTPPKIRWLAFELQLGEAVASRKVTFLFHNFVGGLGVAIDPVRLFGRAP